MGIKYLNGDLIDFTYQNYFDVVIQGNNCFCRQKSGIAKEFVKHFNSDKFEMELSGVGDKNKLGNIDYQEQFFSKKDFKFHTVDEYTVFSVFIVNCYTQYYYGTKYGIPVKYDAIREVMRKLNVIFKGKRIGMPKIGAGLAQGDWNIIENIIKDELTDCDVTVVVFNI